MILLGYANDFVEILVRVVAVLDLIDRNNVRFNQNLYAYNQLFSPFFLKQSWRRKKVIHVIINVAVKPCFQGKEWQLVTME